MITPHDEAVSAFEADKRRIYEIVWEQGRRRRERRHSFTEMALPAIAALPRTEPVRVPSLRDAIRCLFMECAAHYLQRSALGTPMSPTISTQLLVLHGALEESDETCIEVLRDAVIFFVNDQASIESERVSEAIKAARLALIAAQKPGAFLTATGAKKSCWTL